MINQIYLTKFPVLLKVILCAVLLSSQIAVFAQKTPDKLIRGTVQSDSGEPLSGVSVKLKGNLKVASNTDANGRYSIRVPVNAVILFSYVGYISKEVSVNNNSMVNITMLSDQKSLNDVVVIGYGTTRKKDLTGAIGSVNMEDLNKAVVKSFDDAMGGRIAGLQVVSPDGQPGASSNFVLRGPSSVTQDNSPLYVVDGFPLEDNDNNAINPSEIESIDVLKDASATAIYGSRGANGVIIITTKRGKLGAPQISYNAYYGLQKNGHRIEVLSPYEFVKLQGEISSTAYEEYTTDAGKTLEDYQGVKGIDWYGKIFRTAPQQSHNISVIGGSEKTKYALSASMLDQDGIILNSGFRRYQGRFTLDQNINDRIKIGLTTNFSNNKTHGLVANSGGGSASFMWTVWGYRPTQVDPDINIEDLLIDPDIGNAPVRTNPFLQAQNQLRDHVSNTGMANAYAEFAITKQLKLRITGSANLSGGRSDAFDNSKTRSASSLPGSVLGVNGSVGNSSSSTLSSENTLTYSKRFSGHSLTAVGGYSLQTNTTTSFSALASNVPNEELGLSGLDEGRPYSISSRRSNWGLESFFARGSYNYKSKYFLSASIRADGSSKFAPGHKWGYFPAAAVAYRLSEEHFIKNIAFISDAKIRVGYGATGNNRVNDFAYLNSMNFINNNYSFGNGLPLEGGTANGLGNPDLRWETTESTNIGLDLSFFKGRVSFTGDYYNKVTNNLLLNAKLPITTGYASAFKNIGKVSNTGLELTFNTINIDHKQFQWSTNFNISFNRNKVLELSENQEAITTVVNGGTTASYIAKVGQPIGMFYGVIFDGLYDYDDFNISTNGTYTLKEDVPSNSIASIRPNIRPGFIKFRDLNHDGIINNYDFTTIGDPNPDFFGGFTNNFTYGGFDLNLFFQFSYGNEVMNANRINMEEGRNPYTNQFATYANRWTPTNTNTDIPRAGGGSLTNYNTSRVIEDGSFIRFKTASLGYNLPVTLLQKINVKSLRVYVSAQNILTITGYSGSDPEVSVRNSALTPAFDSSAYPRSSIFVAGLSMSL